MFAGGKNFGVPQLLSVAASVRALADADVDVIDLDMERALGPFQLDRRCAGYDLVGISCYSSYEYLKVMAMGEALRRNWPDLCLVTGGYHPSARPDDFTAEGSPFDYVVIGDGELPMAHLARELAAGRRPTGPVLGPDPLVELASLPPVDWSMLERYRPIARRMAGQAELYLSRGCPFSCSFCMERAKRCTTWRALEPEHAVEEMHRLDRFLDLTRWTLFVTDALFGMKPAWRKAFLAGLARRPVRARKVWLLARVDLLDREDLELMVRANVAPGFGLESGAPEQLARIHKAGSAHAFLEHMAQVAAWARELDLPFGANVIVGHPGETESTLRETATYLERVFLDPRGTTGFVSIDPFRMYPGSAIDQELGRWQQETGMRVHRYPWWHDGDQDFLSEWVDPSSELDFRTAQRLRFELFGPIVRKLNAQYSYRGPTRSYFQRSIDEQVALLDPRRRLRSLGLWYLWRELTEDVSDAQTAAALCSDDEIAEMGHAARDQMLRTRKLTASNRVLDALRRVPRERFVNTEDIPYSSHDQALALLGQGGATISAPHAYAASFEALELCEGDDLVDLGSGTGYGAAVAAHVVGASGSVRTFEIDASLFERACRNLRDLPQVTAVHQDAHDTKAWRGATKVTSGFAVERLPEMWIDALAPGGRLVAPVGPPERQELTLVRKSDKGHSVTKLGPVRYVMDRGARARMEEEPLE